jgi:LacI family transcriptional regulator
MVFQAGSTTEDGVKAASQMLNESCKATAVQAVNDLVAIGFADTMLNQGVRIPQDISVVGFGNTITSEYFRVPMTTVRQPKFRLGSAAVDMMVQMLRGQRVETKRLPAELIVRASSAAPTNGTATVEAAEAAS